MPLKNYSVLKGKITDKRLGTKKNAHYQLLVQDASGTEYRVAVNVKSKKSPSELLYWIDEDFQHEITDKLEAAELPDGITPLDSKPNSFSLDFIRRNLFNIEELQALPFDVAGEDNDLNEKIDFHIKRAMKDEFARIYAFGETWGPETVQDKIFKFKPGRGIHDIHFNQGNHPDFVKDDGVWQDGGILLHFPSRNQWVAIFLAFQSQSFHTNDVTGHALASLPPKKDKQETGADIKIIASLISPKGGQKGNEKVYLLNTSNMDTDLTGWQLADRLKNKETLASQILKAGEIVVISLSGSKVQLSDEGGNITLLNNEGLKISGVTYTKNQVKTGFLITF